MLTTSRMNEKAIMGIARWGCYSSWAEFYPPVLKTLEKRSPMLSCLLSPVTFLVGVAWLVAFSLLGVPLIVISQELCHRRGWDYQWRETRGDRE